MLESLHGIVRQSKFNVTEIMTPWSLVQTESYSRDAYQNCAHWRGIFDYIPLMQGKSVKGLLSLESGDFFKSNGVFVKPSAHMLEVFRIATNQVEGKPTAILLGSPRYPKGIITHADMNKQLFRVMLYTIFVTFEARISSLISASGPDDWWNKCLGKNSMEQIEERYSSEHTLEVEIDKLSCTHFSEKVSIIQKTEELHSKLGITRPKSLSRLVRWRNRLVHPTHPPRLIFNRKELTSLWNCMLTIESIMSRIES